jgi:hypothetical protein
MSKGSDWGVFALEPMEAGFVIPLMRYWGDVVIGDEEVKRSRSTRMIECTNICTMPGENIYASVNIRGHPSCPATYLNDADHGIYAASPVHKNNTKFVEQDAKKLNLATINIDYLRLQVLHPIAKDDQLFVAYGKAYWVRSLFLFWSRLGASSLLCVVIV